MATTIEPGVVRIFRWYVAIRVSLLVLVLWMVTQDPDPGDPRVPLAGLVVFAPLLLLLVWPTAQRRLGRAFLPVALVMASAAPIFESAASLRRRVELGLPLSRALADFWQPFFLLFVPLLLVAWQYRYRAVAVFAVGTTLLDLAVTVPIVEGSSVVPRVVAGLLVVRGLLFAFVGLFVVKLVAAQRDARRAMASHAATLEALATSRERNRLARELHDTLAHSLSAVAVQLEAVKARWHDDPAEAHRMLESSLHGARAGLKDARRAIHELRASPLEERGLAGALDELRAQTEARSTMAVEVTVAGELNELDSHVEQAVYRIADEALTNAARHSSASRAEIELRRRGRSLELTVSDDGAGFDVAAGTPNGHHGLIGMKERAAMVGGELAIESRPGAGTTIRFVTEVSP